MRRVVFFVWFVAVVAIATLLTTTNARAPSASEHSGNADRTGQEIWLRDCAVCHGADARGGANGPDISRAGPALVDFMVTTGRMPLPEPGAELVRRTSPYTDSQQRALVAYASTLTHGEEIPDVDIRGADIATGGETYRQQCATCHQAVGSGGALAYGKNAPPLDEATPVQVVEAMRTGPGTMPVFPSSSLDREEAEQIAAYVQTIREPADPGGANLGHLGPVPEGMIAWFLGIGAIILITRFLGRRRTS